MKRILSILVLLFSPVLLLGQTTKDPAIHSDKYTLQVTGTTTTTFAINATANIVSKTYRVWPFMTLGLLTASSGTVEFNVLFETAKPTTNQGCGDATNWVTDKTVAVSATGETNIHVTEAPVAVSPACFRITADGQGSNDASTTAVFVFNGANPYYLTK